MIARFVAALLALVCLTSVAFPREVCQDEASGTARAVAETKHLSGSWGLIRPSQMPYFLKAINLKVRGDALTGDYAIIIVNSAGPGILYLHKHALLCRVDHSTFGVSFEDVPGKPI